MPQTAQGRKYINSLSPMLESGRFVFPKTGVTVEEKPIFETTYVDNSNVKNAKIHQAYKNLLDKASQNGVTPSQLDGFITAFKAIVREELHI
jgi:hypothetical protein